MFVQFADTFTQQKTENKQQESSDEKYFLQNWGYLIMCV
jgi:hypothetical protein